MRKHLTNYWFVGFVSDFVLDGKNSILPSRVFRWCLAWEAKQKRTMLRITPSQTLTFDITAAANKYAGEQITVQMIPQRIRAQGAGPETYPQLRFGQMRIVTEGAGDHHR